MKKLLAIAIVCAFVLTSAIGCGDTKATGGSGAKPPASGGAAAKP